MLTNILIGLGVGLILGIIIGGVVGLIAGYDWRAGQEGRMQPLPEATEPAPLGDSEPARPAVWLPHVKGIDEP